jgi:GDP-4-dehydro-6-deoxy-D-mannose reductase
VKYLITGCYGFVGGYLVRHILAREPDAAIIAVDRGRRKELPVTASYDVDLLDLDALLAIIDREKPEHLIHLASLSSVGLSWQDPVASFTNNTNIFLNVLESIRRMSPATRVLSVGSSEEYGVVQAADLPLRETSPLRPASPYAVARVAQEHLGDVYGRGFGLDIIATRSFNHVGAGQSEQFVISAIGKQFAEVAKGKREQLTVGTTSVVRDFLDVRDVVDAYHKLVSTGARGDVYNVCSGSGISITGAIEIFESISGLRPRVVTDPARMRPVENALVVGSNEKLVATVDWRPTYSISDALRAVYDYWYEQV